MILKSQLLILFLSFIGLSFSQGVGDYDGGAYRSNLFFNGELISSVEEGVRENLQFREYFHEGDDPHACRVEVLDESGREIASYRGSIDSDEVIGEQHEYFDNGRFRKTYSVSLTLIGKNKSSFTLLKKAYRKGRVQELVETGSVISIELSDSAYFDGKGQRVYPNKGLWTKSGFPLYDSLYSVTYKYDQDSNLVDEKIFHEGQFLRSTRFFYNERGQLRSQITFNSGGRKISAINRAFDEHGNVLVTEESPFMDSELGDNGKTVGRYYPYCRTEIEYVWNEYRKEYLWAKRKVYYGNNLVGDRKFTYDERGTLIKDIGYSPGFEYSEITCEIKYLD